MNVAVIGKSGQLAQALAHGSWPSANLAFFGRPEFDLTDPATLGAALATFKPDAIINAAAYTAVDKAESEPEAAFLVNRDGAAALARIAHTIDCPLVHVSTDYVFDGQGSRPYREDDATSPLGVYGASKLAGERAIELIHKRHLILRTAWVHSPWGNNFVKTMLRLGAERESLSIVGDQRGTPTYAPDLAEVIMKVVQEMMSASESDPRWGIYHLTNDGETTWFQFASHIFETASELGHPTPTLTEITTAQYPTPAKRPSYSVLDNSRLEKAFNITRKNWQSGSTRCVRALLST